MRQNGFTVEVENVSSLDAVKAEHGVPQILQSCHTAIVDGYVLEGHVPIDDIRRLLDEKPDVAGIAVPGMPVGSPGMEVPDVPDEPYDVYVFRSDGSSEVFASHN